MRFNRTLAFGILACLAAGVLIGASEATIQGKPDDSPMTVPVSRMGDQVTYALYDRGDDVPPRTMTIEGSTSAGPLGVFFLDAAEGAESGGSQGEGEPSFIGARTFEFLALETRTDRTGERHDTVVIGMNWGLPEGPSVDRTENEVVDLGTRWRIQDEMSLDVSRQNLDYDLHRTDFGIRRAELDGLEFQGATLRLGQEVAFAQDVPWAQPDDGPPPISETKRRHVAERALIDGRDSYGVVEESAATLDLSEDERALLEEILRREVPVRIGVVRSETIWVSSETPYPVLTELQSSVVLGEEVVVLENKVASLQEVKAGPGAQVAWGQDRSDTHYRSRNPSLERSSSQRFPADGAGGRLAYPLSAAVRDVLADATLTGFQAWRQQRPDHHLVSVDLVPGEHATKDSPTHMWRLVFATPAGEAFMVSTERVHAALPPYAEDRGGLTVPAFDLSDLPEAPVTIGAAEALWREVASPEYLSRPLNHVHWGYYTEQTSGRACVGTMMRITSTSRDMLKVLEVGHTTWGSCVATTMDAETAHAVLSLDTVSGNLSGFFGHRTDWRTQPLGAFSQEYRPVQRQEKVIPFSPQPPNVERVAIASTSLLAAFLAIYFLPALKFVGTKALLFLPGYARLRKEELLDSKVREQILQVVRNDPGVTTTELCERIDAGWGTTVYHLGVLEKNGLLSSLVDGRYHRFFPVGEMDFSARGQVAALRNARTREIYELIAQDPGIIQESLASRIGVSAPAAIFHLRRLEEVGMVGRVRRGRRVHYYANESKVLHAPADAGSGIEFQ